jgi:hypothetical protein
MNVTLMSVWTKKYYLVICEWIFESVALDEMRWSDNEVFLEKNGWFFKVVGCGEILVFLVVSYNNWNIRGFESRCKFC